MYMHGIYENGADTDLGSTYNNNNNETYMLKEQNTPSS